MCCPDPLDAARPGGRRTRCGLNPAACGWDGLANYIDDTGKIAAVVRTWEDRYGARVVELSRSELLLSVAAPPTALDEAPHGAAEHFALCPDLERSGRWSGPSPK
ncbi:DUF4253 domain-containing protein [Planotetraspora phitsanulokensis]|uniref:DUF4253 domain-containing protein n=1 Tax=Planotetraspora phitsanulokensis TaxID=575192 RepID=UPI003570EAE4